MDKTDRGIQCMSVVAKIQCFSLAFTWKVPAYGSAMIWICIEINYLNSTNLGPFHFQIRKSVFLFSKGRY